MSNVLGWSFSGYMGGYFAGKLPLKPRNLDGSDRLILYSDTLSPDLNVEISFGKKSCPTSRPRSNSIFPPGTSWKLSIVAFSYPFAFLTSLMLSWISSLYLYSSLVGTFAILSTTDALILTLVPSLLEISNSTTFPLAVPCSIVVSLCSVNISFKMNVPLRQRHLCL